MRTPLPLVPPHLDAFCALATERARLRWPACPPLDAQGLAIVSKWANGWWLEKVVPPWHLRVEDLDDGPAEAIHVDRWRATVTLPEGELRVELERVHQAVAVWEES